MRCRALYVKGGGLWPVDEPVIPRTEVWSSCSRGDVGYEMVWFVVVGVCGPARRCECIE